MKRKRKPKLKENLETSERKMGEKGIKRKAIGNKKRGENCERKEKIYRKGRKRHFHQ